jgi:hypothetical protein
MGISAPAVQAKASSRIATAWLWTRFIVIPPGFFV